MACTIDSTIGGASANSYCAIAAADAYHEAHLYASAWASAVTDTKCKALQMATRLLDAMFEWDGEVVASAQRLLFPRYGVIGANGLEVPSDALPPELVIATAEFARQLITANTAADSAVEVAGLKSLRVGPVELTFENAVGRPVPDAVFFLVSHLGRPRSRGAGSIPLQRC